jgi:hypothetical protein
VGQATGASANAHVSRRERLGLPAHPSIAPPAPLRVTVAAGRKRRVAMSQEAFGPWGQEHHVPDVQPFPEVRQ